jgi:hypothetical protein
MVSVAWSLRCFLVEWYRAETLGVAVEDFTAVLDDCAASLSADDRRVQLLTVLVVPADEVTFGVFAATSADLVASVCDRAGIPAQRLSAAIDTRIPHP